jgi:superfamily II DNA or RNA helicase
VRSLASARARLDLGAYALAVVDECHASYAKSYRDGFLAALSPSARVLGLTATPFRSGANESLVDVFPNAVFGPSIASLVRLGVLVPPVVYGPKWPTMPPTHRAPPRGAGTALAAARSAAGGVAGRSAEDFSVWCDGDGRSAQAAAELQQWLDDAVAQWQVHAAGRRTVAFCESVATSKALARAFEAAGVAAQHVDGTTADDARSSAFRALHEHSLEVRRRTEGGGARGLRLTSCAVAERGVAGAVQLRRALGGVRRTARGMRVVAQGYQIRTCLHPAGACDLTCD